LKNQLGLMYKRMADFITENLELQTGDVILEAGCGRGQLTIPLARKTAKIVKKFKILAFDLHSGPYIGEQEALKKAIAQAGLTKFITPILGDTRRMKDIRNKSVDVIISNELFCDLDREGLERTIREFYRVLKRGSQMTHGDLSPVPETPAQKLLMEADAHSSETIIPRPEWFSPSTDEVAALLHKSGFTNITIKYFKTNVQLPFDEAIKQLRKWKIDQDFIRRNIEELKKYGLEFPMEPFAFCEKPTRQPLAR
jgi:ubiquinone/menaquinone biosynthesis C-methylase UbiE